MPTPAGSAFGGQVSRASVDGIRLRCRAHNQYAAECAFGTGFMSEMGLEQWYRDVRAMRLYEGTSEILRNNVAKTLGLP